MKTNEFYYLVMVCTAFSVFGLALATNYVRYRRLLKEQSR
jgi:hypothetical protein